MHNRCLYWFVPIGCQPQINIPPWKGIMHRKKSPGWRLYSLFFQGLSLLLDSRSLFSIPQFTDFLPRILGMTLGTVIMFGVPIFHHHALTQWTFLYPSALIALLASDKISSLSLSPMAGNTVLLYQDEWASPAKAWWCLSAWGPE